MKSQAKTILTSLTQELTYYRNALLHIVYPLPCVVCGGVLSHKERSVCTHCTQKIALLKEPQCRMCARELPPFAEKPTKLCRECRTQHYSFDRTISTLRYDETTKHLLHNIKFYNKRSLLALFNEHIGRTLVHHQQMLQSCDMIIPVPLDPWRMRERDFNQSTLLARAISTFLQRPLVLNTLKRTHKAIPQSHLLRTARLSNVKGAFTITRKNTIIGKHILLVDDVFTTGTTVNECALSLRNAGVHAITVYTLARTLQ